jgi:hypothetical protein
MNAKVIGIRQAKSRDEGELKGDLTTPRDPVKLSLAPLSRELGGLAVLHSSCELDTHVEEI